MEHVNYRDIIKRRFGPEHEKPCKNPSTATCALWECQKANECQHGNQAAPTPSEPVAWLRDLDGTGSLHACSEGDPGAIAVVPIEELYALQSRLAEVEGERDNQYDENVNRIAAEGAAVLRAEAAEKRLRDLVEAFDKSFITANSVSGEYYIRATFATAAEMHDAHNKLVKLPGFVRTLGDSNE